MIKYIKAAPRPGQINRCEASRPSQLEAAVQQVDQRIDWHIKESEIPHMIKEQMMDRRVQ